MLENRYKLMFYYYSFDYIPNQKVEVRRKLRLAIKNLGNLKYREILPEKTRNSLILFSELSIIAIHFIMVVFRFLDF